MFHLSKSKHINFLALHQAADNLAGRIPALRQRRKLRRTTKILKYAGLVSAVLLTILFILAAARFFTLKKIYDQAILAKSSLEQAIIFAKQDNFERAGSLARLAEENFKFAAQGIDDVKNDFFARRLPYISEQLTQAQNLMISAQFLSKAVYGGANFGASLEAVLSSDKKLNFSRFSQLEKRAVMEKIYQAGPELNGVKADLDLAFFNLDQVGTGGVLYFFRDQLAKIKEQLNQARQILAKAVPMSQLVPALAGYPKPAKFLVLLENNDELRPSGGFLGTYGVLQTQDGEITDFYTHDIYHLDMPVQDKFNVIPPAPIKKYLNNKWYLRDANWSPDWPTAARQINWFYRLESGLNPQIPQAEKIFNFDGVLAFTPKLISDFLKITGPLKIEGQTYDANNFQDLLQYRVEKGYQILGVSSWQRKEVIGEIAKELKIKIFDLPSAQWSKIVSALLGNLDTKNLLLYLSDNQLENIAASYGWSGAIKNFNGDYLMVVDANLAALKTDAVMSRGLKYNVEHGPGGLFSQLTLNYAHNGQTDWKTSAYKSYTRVYVPLGSKLISLTGYAPELVDTGVEAGKTWFGFYFEVPPGEIKNLVLKYKLPSSIATAGSYQLYLQKQPGKDIGSVQVDLNFANDIKSYSPNSLSVVRLGTSELAWEGDLSIDRSFNVNF